MYQVNLESADVFQLIDAAGPGERHRGDDQWFNRPLSI